MHNLRRDQNWDQQIWKVSILCKRLPHQASRLKNILMSVSFEELKRYASQTGLAHDLCLLPPNPDSHA
jgi:hypothetical protein